MSRRALHRAVRDQLRLPAPDGLGLANEVCDLTFDGRPPPMCGKLFVAIHQGPRRRGMYPAGLDDKFYSFQVTVTLRVNEPFDRLGPETLGKLESGLDDLVDAVAILIQVKSDAILTAANETLGASYNEEGLPRGFIEQICYEDDGPAKQVDATWFHAVEQRISGLANTIRFGGARRIQEWVNPVAS